MSVKHKFEKDKAVKLIKEAKNIMVLSGAGLSTEAGIPDFRSKNGLYSHNFHGYRPETVLSHSFYNENPDLFWEYMKTKLNYTDNGPDDSYKLLAKLEQSGKIKAIVTQNIDSLHYEAGSKNVIEVHGTLKKCYCDSCLKEYSYSDLVNGLISYKCSCGGNIRPDVVLFDEDVPKIYNAVIEADKCDLLLVLGTSLVVYPVASIPRIFLEKNHPVIIINRDETPYHGVGNVTEINDSLGSTLKYIFSDYTD
ncbi:MAG: NAD-dependent protein deacylase [Clostridiaceae bacterium]